MGRKKHNYDPSDKTILKRFKDEIARDIFKFKDAVEVEIIDSNLQISREQRADTVFLIKNKDSKDVLLHIEVQTSDDENMPRRMHSYRFFLEENYPGKNVVQAVLYLGNEKPRMKNVYETGMTVEIPEIDIKSVSSTRTEFVIIDIGEKTVEQILQSKKHFLLSFLCLAERERRAQDPNVFVESCINKAKEVFKSPEEEEMLKTVYEGIAIHSPLIGADKNFITEILRKEGVEKMINLKELPFYEEVYEEGKMEGKIEGKMEGKKEVAKNLLKLGIEINEILTVTGLSEEDLKEIEEDIKEEAVDSHLNRAVKSKKNIKL